MINLESIRKAEKSSHEDIYSNAVLFEKGSWLYKPVKTVMDVLPLFSDYDSLTVLDLGCGVGRNSIPIAQFCQNKFSRIDCVDILDLAIEKLTEYSKEYGVFHIINGIVSPIDEFRITSSSYDFILAVSALEHVDSDESFDIKLEEIRNGLKENGVACLIVNSQVVEKNKDNGELVVPQFEVNYKTDELLSVLNKKFEGFSILKSSVVSQNYDIPRDGFVSELTTDVVTFVARKSI